jgi:hypothetical protein
MKAMDKKKNHYERQAQKKSLLGSITKDLDTKGDVKNSAIETLKDLVVGVIGGGVVGAALGRASLAVGAVVTGIGHYAKSRLASIFGVGMMASGGFQKQEAVSGTESTGVLDGVKERVQGFKESLSQKLFLDKILKSKKQDAGATNGMGEVQYFVYPPSKELEGATDNELDMTALERIERQVAESGEEFTRNQQMKGILPADEMGSLDSEERIY